MKNDKMASAYLSTTQAAHRLGLSVGTVQRMVESGVLQAYTTQGGHRRILTTSLNHYCRGALGTATGHPQVCVLSSPAHVTAELDALNLLDGLQVITNPLELAGIQDKVGVLFLDARIPWLPCTWPTAWVPKRIASSTTAPISQKTAKVRCKPKPRCTRAMSALTWCKATSWATPL